MRTGLNRTGWHAAGSIWLVLAGCSTGTGALHTDPDGWRYARISAIGDAIRPRPTPTLTPTIDCRAAVGGGAAAGGAAQRYAAVIYLERYHLRHRIVALPVDGRFEAGERVFVNVTDCAIPAAPRLSETGSMPTRSPAGTPGAMAEAMRHRKSPQAVVLLGGQFDGGPLRGQVWWSWGESNPRPKAIAGQIYTLS